MEKTNNILIEYDQYENMATAKLNGCVVASLDFDNDDLIILEDLTESEQDEIYASMQAEREQFIYDTNQFTTSWQ